MENTEQITSGNSQTTTPQPIQEEPTLTTTLTTTTTTPALIPVPLKPAALLPRRIQILSWTTGDYPMVAIYGLRSLTQTFYLVLKRRLGCLGSCGSYRIELFNATAEDAARLLVSCDFPEEWISIQKL